MFDTSTLAFSSVHPTRDTNPSADTALHLHLPFTYAGDATTGSANEWGMQVEVENQPTGSPAPYEKSPAIFWADQLDPSTYVGINGTQQVTRDIVAFVSSGNLLVDYGRVWGGNIYTTKSAGMHGFVVGMEFDTQNDGVDCFDPNDSINGAWGMLFGANGAMPQTVGIRWGNEGGQGTRYLVHVAAGAIAPGGYMIHSDADFLIAADGHVKAWTQVVAAVDEVVVLKDQVARLQAVVAALLVREAARSASNASWM